METKNIRPSPLQNKNLAILYGARTAYFPYKGLYPYLLSTYFFYIEERARLPLTRNLLPLINDANNRGILEMAVNEQREWEPLKPFESSWTFFRKIGMGSTKNQQFEDLLQLDYYRLFEGVDIPESANLSLFWGGLVDFLINSWSILEEFCIVIEIKGKMEEEHKRQQEESLEKNDQTSPVNKSVGSWKTVVTWPDMQLEHHFINIIIRIRAGWDKLANYIIAKYYGVNEAKKWEAMLRKLDREIKPILNDNQRMFWENWLANAKAISKGIKEARDFELHKIATRAKETLGNPRHTYPLNDLENIVLFEHFRLQESFLLILAMIRSA